MIKFDLVANEVFGYQLIRHSFFSDYIFENGFYTYEADYNGKTVSVELQTGNGFLHGDYSMPVPNYSVYRVDIDQEEISLDDIQENDFQLYEAIQDLTVLCVVDTDPENYNYNVYFEDEKDLFDICYSEVENLMNDPSKNILNIEVIK